MSQSFADLAAVAAYQAAHADKLFIVMYGKVLDVTTFADVHPGGAEVLNNFKGKDATDAFKDVGHTKEAFDTAMSKVIGTVASEAAKVEAAAAAPVMSEEEKKKRIAAVKPSAIWGYVPLIVGLLVGTAVYVGVKELRRR